MSETVGLAIVDIVTDLPKSPVPRSLLVNCLSGLSYPEREVLETLADMVHEGQLLEETDGLRVMLEPAGDKVKQRPAPEKCAEIIGGLDRDTFQVVDCVLAYGECDVTTLLTHYTDMEESTGQGGTGPMLKAVQSGLIRLGLDKYGDLVLKSHPVLQEHAQTIRERSLRDHEENRSQLIAYLQKRFDLSDDSPILRALKAVDRRTFIPEPLAPWGDIDRPVRLADRDTTSAVHALVMTLQPTDPKPGEKVLICGNKGGVLAALAGVMVGGKGQVLSLDASAANAGAVVKALKHYDEFKKVVTVEVQEDLSEGREQQGPWDVIIVNGSVPKVPYDLFEQLDNEKGRILFFLSDPGGSGDTAYLVRKNEEVLKDKELSRFVYSAIYGRYGWDKIDQLQQSYDRAREMKTLQKNVIERIQTVTPYPLARMYCKAIAIQTTSPEKRLNWMLQSFQVLLKYYAFPCMVEMDRLEINDQVFDAYVSQITIDSFGLWHMILSRGASRVRETPVGRTIHADLFEPVALSDVVQAHARLDSMVADGRFGKRKVSLISFLGHVVAYRNKFFAHNVPRPGAEQGEICELLLKTFSAILPGLQLCSKFRLVHVAETRLTKRGGYTVSAMDLTGSAPRAMSWETTEQVVPDTVYLFRDNRPVVSLSPWMVYAKGEQHKEDLFLYLEKKKYSTHFDYDEYPPKALESEVQEYLQRHKGKGLISQYEILLRNAAVDGIVDKREILKLIGVVTALGLADSDEAAEAKILKDIREVYPNTHMDRT